MRLVWCGPMYPHPDGCAGGAEWAAHETLLTARRRGHDAGFWHAKARRGYELEGVPVYADAPKGRVDWVIGQLGNEHAVSMFAKRAKARLGWMLHAPNQVPPSCDLVLANSLHVHEHHPDSLLLRPHVPEYRYEGHERGSAVTLVNLSKWKGAQTLHDLTQALPDTRFLGVRGAWDEQRWKPGRYENLTVWECQPVMDTVLSATRILLMPSASESGAGSVSKQPGGASPPSPTPATASRKASAQPPSTRTGRTRGRGSSMSRTCSSPPSTRRGGPRRGNGWAAASPGHAQPRPVPPVGVDGGWAEACLIRSAQGWAMVGTSRQGTRRRPRPQLSEADGMRRMRVALRTVPPSRVGIPRQVRFSYRPGFPALLIPRPTHPQEPHLGGLG